MWLEIVKTLLSISDKRKDMELEKRERLSKAFQLMSDVIGKAVEDLQANSYPMGSCIAMEQLASDILKAVGDIMPKEEAQQLANQLHMASFLELEYAMRDKPDTIPTLQKAQGKLIALSILYSI